MNPLVHVEIAIDGARDRRTVVCLLHGFGASAQDLVPLSGEIGTVRRWIFPHAPVPISIAGMSYGRAWFPRTESEMERALYGGYFLSLRAIQPAGLVEAAREVRSLVDDLSIAWDDLVLGGFSQGAIVAAEVIRRAVADGGPFPRAVVVFSGALVAEQWWRETRSGANSSTAPLRLPPVCAFHGAHDAVLPYAEGEALRDALESLGFSVEWNRFEGGHEIPASAVQRAREVLSALNP
jgi:phospholipase/carboxylesterase